jgi:hypothetical protein
MRKNSSLVATLAAAAAALPCFTGVATARVIRGGLLLAAMGTALAAAATPLVPSASAASPAVVAVWALADGDTPLAGARVRILKGDAVLRQDNGTRREVTSRAGVSLLDLRRLPRRFTVEVVPRQRLGGTFRALVRRHRAGAVVHVNPVTTLIANVLTAHRRRGRAISPARVRREVFRFLGIPHWHDHADLRYSDKAFDGDTYLRAARKAGGVAALNRSLVQRVLEDEERRRFRQRRKNARASAGPEEFVEKAFFNLLSFAGKSAGEVAAKRGGEAVLGWLLAGFGLNDDLVPQQLTEIRSSLDAIGKQLTALKNNVVLAGFSTLVHQTDPTIGEIKYAAEQLDVIAALPQGDKTKAGYTQELIEYIGSRLRDAPNILNEALDPGAPLADNLIRAASRLVENGTGRFFEQVDSAQARSVYDYFAAHQTRLAILLTEYYHARPDVYSPQTTETLVTSLHSKVVAQAQSVKPPVPSGAVVDTETGLMWTQRFKPHSLYEFARISQSSISWQGRLSWVADKFGLPDLPFTNWSLPTPEQVDRLIAGWSNSCCSLGWLQTEGGFGPMTAPIILYPWLGYGFSSARMTEMEADIQVYDLLHDKIEYARVRWTATRNSETNQALGEAGLKRLDLTAIKVRQPAPGETYWWSS